MHKTNKIGEHDCAITSICWNLSFFLLFFPFPSLCHRSISQYVGAWYRVTVGAKKGMGMHAL